MSAESMSLPYLLAAVVRRLVCGLAGHRWEKATWARARYCSRCHAAENLHELPAAPPAGHPDSTPVPLDQPGREYLAWLESEFTGKAA
jgi:hypothetical protein